MITKLDSVLLTQKKFIYHYKNVRWARGRHETYLCFVVKRRDGPDTLSFDFGHLRNRSGCHVELVFLRHLGALCPGLWGSASGGPKLSYSVTWFCSWSPCYNCSRRLAHFLTRTPNLKLRIFCSRLYFCDVEDSGDSEGLRLLKRAGVQLSVMTYKGMEIQETDEAHISNISKSACMLLKGDPITFIHSSNRHLFSAGSRWSRVFPGITGHNTE
ncbi:single-stranded DNA cytosine deaminase isoform X2 [Scleropages formosus]|uniref:single-stranded DNA cytosine deaminase isoform X2 n=1 Tax=Scleropages formosus TaxID=113540 RepID=UPI0008782EAB|nr:single-stranded DNA cytosine deaminase-like isoform X2 [Scleropages formosus]